MNHFISSAGSHKTAVRFLSQYKATRIVVKTK